MGGFKAGEKKEDGEYDAEFHKERIFGGHVGEYMESLKEEDETQYQKLYAKYIEEDIEADGLEDMYKEAHAKIRASPMKPKKESKPVRTGNKITSEGKTWTRKVRLNHKDRKARVAQKIANAQRKMMED